MNVKFFVILSVLNLNGLVKCFIPSKIVEYVIGKVDNFTQSSFGKIGDTITHEEILRRGLAKSITKFFYDQKNGSKKIDLSKINNEYYDYRNIYKDYYGKTICTLKVSDIMKVELGPNIGLVDLDPTTKDMPYAHFDAEKFTESNTRVINFTNFVNFYLDQKNYEKARELTAQILHTIQDFYSHSNWIEMGNTNGINYAIGKANFTSIPVADSNDTQTCVSNCTLVETPCNRLTQDLIDLLKLLNLTSSIFQCPLKFYRCQGNLVILDKLVSGYYTGQKLDDGTSVPKPLNLLKCSHGGLMDLDSFIAPTGGINKDSSFYLFSPRADLHEIAANLAIDHTEYYFNEIRSRIGDIEFDNFLELTYDQSELNKFSANSTCNGFFNVVQPDFFNIFFLISIVLIF